MSQTRTMTSQQIDDGWCLPETAAPASDYGFSSAFTEAYRAYAGEEPLAAVTVRTE